jgi:hypothetical protein
MALLDHNGESEFPISKDKVFDAMCRAIPTIKGMKIDNADKLQGRIMVKAGVTLWSWGENIPIQLLELSENKTRVQITSSPKTGILLGGAFDMGKNRKNIENILSTTSRILSSQQNQTTSTDNNKQTNNFQTNQNSNFMEQQNTTSNAWYEKTWVVVLLCIFFFPVGLYALWKNSTIGKGWKIGVTAVIALIVIANIGDKKESTSNDAASTTTETQSTSQPVQVNSAPTEADIQAEQASAEKEAIIEKLKARAKRDWPNDYTTQEFWVNEQIEAYEYMLTIENNSIKKQAQRDWPLDYATQKFWYNEQIEAKERMK